MPYLPGTLASRTVTPRRVLQQAGKDREIIVAGLIDGAYSYDGSNTSYEKHVRGGWLLGRDSTSKKWAPLKRTKANGAGSATATLVVDNAAPFKAGETLVIGSTTGVISSIVYSTNTITLTATKTWGDNDPVYVSGGFGTARGILLDDEVSLWDFEHVTNVDKSAKILVAGFADQDKILGDITAALEDYDSAVALRGVIFDDYQDGTDSRPETYLPFGLRRAQLVTGNYTVTAADNGTLFVANAAATFTLPTKAANLTFGFVQTADANLVISSAGSADDIVADGDAGADTVTFSTASHKIGSAILVTCSPDLTKWLSFNVNATTATIA